MEAGGRRIHDGVHEGMCDGGSAHLVRKPGIVDQDPDVETRDALLDLGQRVGLGQVGRDDLRLAAGLSCASSKSREEGRATTYPRQGRETRMQSMEHGVRRRPSNAWRGTSRPGHGKSEGMSRPAVAGRLHIPWGTGRSLWRRPPAGVFADYLSSAPPPPVDR